MGWPSAGVIDFDGVVIPGVIGGRWGGRRAESSGWSPAVGWWGVSGIREVRRARDATGDTAEGGCRQSGVPVVVVGGGAVPVDVAESPRFDAGGSPDTRGGTPRTSGARGPGGRRCAPGGWGAPGPSGGRPEVRLRTPNTESGQLPEPTKKKNFF
jgi:hypothetical protein